MGGCGMYVCCAGPTEEVSVSVVLQYAHESVVPVSAARVHCQRGRLVDDEQSVVAVQYARLGVCNGRLVAVQSVADDVAVAKHCRLTAHHAIHSDETGRDGGRLTRHADRQTGRQDGRGRWRAAWQ